MPKKKKAMPKARSKGKSPKATKKSKVTRSKTTRKTTTRKVTARKATSPPALYKCEKCGATFTDPEMLEKHRQSHLTAATIVASPQILEGEEGGLQGQPRTPPSSPPPEPEPEPEPMSPSGPAP